MIYQYIRRCQLRKLIYPIGLLTFSLLLSWWMPLKNQLFPAHYSLTENLKELTDGGYSYVTLTADKLYDTGCDYMKNGRITGHYYYSLTDGTCQFFLLGLSPSGHETVMEEVPLTGKILYSTDMYEKLVSHTAASLGWTEKGVREISSPYVITTLHYVTKLDILLYAMLGISFLCSMLGIASMLHTFFCPDKADTFSRLSHYPGSHSLAQVEEEIRNRTLVSAGPFYVTEHYLVALTDSETLILPLNSILWLYRHSSFFKLFGHHKRPTYYLAFMDQYGKIFECSTKNKEDSTSVIRTIRKFQPDILIGYTQENKETAEKRMQPSE